MTTPSIAQKRLLAAGAKKSAQTWGTAEALGAGYGMLIDSDGGLVRNQTYHPAREADTVMPEEGDLGPIDAVDFTPEFFLRYDPGAIGILLAQLFGTAGSPAAAGNGWRHTFQWAEENYGEFCTFAVERRSKIFEVPSAKPYSFDLSIADGFVRGSIGLRGNTLVNTGTENEAAEMDALTYADRGRRIKFSELLAYLTYQTNASNPDQTTAIEISDISMHFERPHDAIHPAGSESIIEPMENEFGASTMTLTFPRMNTINDPYFAEFIAETEKKACMWFHGPVLQGAQLYEFDFYFPRLRVINVDYPFDEVIPCTMTLAIEKAATYTGFLSPYPYIRPVNLRTTDYLA